MVSWFLSLKYQKRQAILIMFCVSESLALIVSNIGIIFTNLNPERGILNFRKAKRRGQMNGIRWNGL